MNNSIHADLFKLQRDELLGRLRPRYETKLASADREVHKLQAVISAIPHRDALPVCRFLSSSYASLTNVYQGS